MEKYQIKEIDKNFVVGGTSARTWTRDRDLDIYLRNVANGREDISFRTTWTFFWSGTPYTLRLDLLSSTGRPNGPGSSRWGLIWVNGQECPNGIPANSRAFLNDLHAALLAYKDGGVFSQTTDYSVELISGEEQQSSQSKIEMPFTADFLIQ